jgi:hypothetical protein
MSGVSLNSRGKTLCPVIEMLICLFGYHRGRRTVAAAPALL